MGRNSLVHLGTDPNPAAPVLSGWASFSEAGVFTGGVKPTVRAHLTGTACVSPSPRCCQRAAAARGQTQCCSYYRLLANSLAGCGLQRTRLWLRMASGSCLWPINCSVSGCPQEPSPGSWYLVSLQHRFSQLEGSLPITKAGIH